MDKYIRVKNCNCISDATIEIVEKSLNIKYGSNGTGKSTISEAIYAQANNETDRLKDFKPYGSNDNSQPTVDNPYFHVVKVFNEDYVNSYLFQGDEFLDDSFQVFLKSDKCDSLAAQIERMLEELQDLINNIDAIHNLRTFLPQYTAAVKASDGTVSRRGGVAEFVNGNGGGFNHYSELKAYKPFYSRDSFKEKTVLMLTHDFQPIIDYVHGNFFTRYGLITPVHASFIQNIEGSICESPITMNDLKNTVELTKDIVMSSNASMAVKIVNLRKYVELTKPEFGTSAIYEVLSNVIHGRQNPIYKDGQEISADVLEQGMREVSQYIPNKSYTDLINGTSTEILISSMSSDDLYHRIISIRLLFERVEGTLSLLRKKYPAACKFVNETNHVENDYIYQLDPRKYFGIPNYYLQQIENFIQENKETILAGNILTENTESDQIGDKMPFLLSFIDHMDTIGDAKIEDVLTDYIAFYQDRIDKGLPVDRPSCPYNAETLKDRKMIKSSMLTNPFEKFERKRFMYYSKDLGVISLNHALLAKMSEGD